MPRNGESAAMRHGFRAGSGTSKVRITIRLDREVLDWFHSRAEDQGGGNYQTMINNALRDHIHQGGEPVEALLRRVIREELKRGGPEAGVDVIPRGRL
jgi:hypothetical protein